MSNCRNTPALSNSSAKCEKVCVEVRRIFDACIQRKSVENARLTVSFPRVNDAIADPVESVTNSGPCVISNLTITPVPGSLCSRVRYTLTIPISVVKEDCGNNVVTGTTSFTLQQDLLLKIPASSVLVPVEIQAVCNVTGLNGVLSDSVLTCTLCITIITKVYADVIISIPTYGYPCIPPCQEFEEDICEEVFNRPIFPTTGIPLGAN
ncbi:MAG: hypothetical protein PHC84_01610 [Clostridia bacterium]|nr:hypothetical protein [Clostridia bacterium]